MWGKGKLVNSCHEWKVNIDGQIACRNLPHIIHRRKKFFGKIICYSLKTCHMDKNMLFGWMILNIDVYAIIPVLVRSIKSYKNCCIVILSIWMCWFVSRDYWSSSDIAEHLWRIRRLYQLEVPDMYYILHITYYVSTVIIALLVTLQKNKTELLIFPSKRYNHSFLKQELFGSTWMRFDIERYINIHWRSHKNWTCHCSSIE